MSPSPHLQHIGIDDLSFINVDYDLMNAMDTIRTICSTGLSIRKDKNIRTRMPLNKMSIYCKKDNQMIKNLKYLIENEVNVKDVIFVNQDFSEIVNLDINIDLKKCGQKYGKELAKILLSQKTREWQLLDNKKLSIENTNIVLEEDEFNIIYTAKDKTSDIKIIENGEILISLDTDITKDLAIECVARDIIRIIQNKRKEMDLAIDTKIEVYLGFQDEKFAIYQWNFTTEDVMTRYKNHIASQVLANNITIDKNNYEEVNEIDGSLMSLRIITC